MFACSCRAIRDSEVEDYLTSLPLCPRRAKPDWDEVSREVSGEPIICGACIPHGRKLIDTYRKEPTI